MAARRRKAGTVVRLFQDFAFASQCSAELLRRGARDIATVETGKHGVLQVRLLHGFQYAST